MQTRSIGYELKFPRDVVKRAANWIGTAWQAILRSGGLLWPTTADVALRSLPKEESDFSILFARENDAKSLWEATRTFHDLTRNGQSIEDTQRADLWRGDHDVDFEKLDRDHKLNITALLLATNISSNLEKLNGIFILPPRNEKDLEHWMSTNINWYWNDMNAGDGEVCKRVPFNQYNSVEYSVRASIENAWRNLQKGYYESEVGITKKNATPGLRWENTAICAIDAVYQTISTLDQACKGATIAHMSNMLHERMIKHKLWGNDTNNLDRSDDKGNPLPFNKVSKEMKENYVLIMLATLSAIGDY